MRSIVSSWVTYDTSFHQSLKSIMKSMGFSPGINHATFSHYLVIKFMVSSMVISPRLNTVMSSHYLVTLINDEFHGHLPMDESCDLITLFSYLNQ